MPRGQKSSKNTVEKKKSVENIFNISEIFHKIWSGRNSLQRSILLSVWLLLSVLVLSLGFVFGYIFQYIKNILEDKREFLPDWSFKEGIGKFYLNGWKLFLVVLPYILLNWLLSYLFIRNILFFIPVLFYIFSVFTLPYNMIRYVECEDYKKLLDLNSYWEFLTGRFFEIIGLVMLSIGIYAFAMLGVIGLIFVAFTLSWAMLITTYQWTVLYKENK